MIPMKSIVRLVAALMVSTLAHAQNWEARNGPGRGFHMGAAAAPDGGVLQFGGITEGSLSAPSSFVPSIGVPWTWRYDLGDWEELQVEDGPPPLFRPMMCHDPSRGRTVLFGGLKTGFPDDPPETWEWDGATWEQVFPSTSPSALTAGAMAFDPSRGVIVLQGGIPFSGAAIDETWEYDGQDWQQILTANSPVQVGWGTQGMAFSPALGVIVRLVGSSPNVETWHYDGVDWIQNTALIGGPPIHSLVTGPSGHVLACGRQLVSGAQHETWRYDGASWQTVVTATTPPASNPSWTVFDETRNVVLQAFLDEVWRFDGVDWSQERSSTMRRTNGSAIAFDARRERLVMFGGNLGTVFTVTGPSDEHWEWDGQVWQQRTFAITPPANNLLVGCYDKARERMVVCELSDSGGASPLNEVWEYDGQAWIDAGTAPPGITNVVGLAYDPGRKAVMALTEGYWWPFHANELWSYDGTTWTQLPTMTQLPFRSDCVFDYDAARDCLVVYGGMFGSSPRSDTWEFVGGDWVQRHPQIRPTTGFVTGGYDPTRGRVVARALWDKSMWEFDGAIWHALPSELAPPTAHCYRAYYDSGREQMSGIGWHAEVSAWRPDAVPHWAATGHGCVQPASLATAPPELLPGAGSAPALGATFTLEVQSLADADAPVLLLLSERADVVAGQSLPLALDGVGLGGCQLWLAPVATEAAFATSGVASFDVPLPANFTLAGLHLWAQAVEVDGSAPLGIGGLSNAGVATLH